MSATTITRAFVWEDGDAACMARVTLNGSNITQSTISSISRKVFDLDSATPTTAISTTTPAVASTVFNTLQTDGRWTVDAIGYNFRDTIAASVITDAHRYRVEYVVTGASGEKFVMVFVLVALEIYSS